MTELSQRARQVLYHAVMEYVATGDPVGSRTLAKKCGLELSPASIRNVLADLEELGYLRQPHTSAGRVPTDRAFRLFIDALMEVRELSEMEHARIRERFEGLEPGQNMLRESGRLLSDLTGKAAVVVAARSETLALKHMRFIRTQPGELLAVIVMSNGLVQNRFLHASFLEDELVRIHNLLDEAIEGRSLGELRELFARKLDERDALRSRAYALGGAAVKEAVGAETDVVIEGQSKLFRAPEFADLDGIKNLAEALDEREQLIRLLDATMAADGVTVLVGAEAGELGGGQLSVVGARIGGNSRNAGVIGVIGPTRMDYPKVVPLVTATARAMSGYLDRSRDEGSGRARSDDDDDDRR